MWWHCDSNEGPKPIELCNRGRTVACSPPMTPSSVPQNAGLFLGTLGKPLLLMCPLSHPILGIRVSFYCPQQYDNRALPS